MWPAGVPILLDVCIKPPMWNETYRTADNKSETLHEHLFFLIYIYISFFFLSWSRTDGKARTCTASLCRCLQGHIITWDSFRTIPHQSLREALLKNRLPDEEPGEEQHKGDGYLENADEFLIRAIKTFCKLFFFLFFKKELHNDAIKVAETQTLHHTQNHST